MYSVSNSMHTCITVGHFPLTVKCPAGSTSTDYTLRKHIYNVSWYSVGQAQLNLTESYKVVFLCINWAAGLNY